MASGVVGTLVVWLPLRFVAAVHPDSPLVDRLIRTWSRAWIVPSGIDLTVEGLDHLDPDETYVVVSNHQSTLDVMVHFLALPIPLRFMAKKELYRIPVFGPAIRAIGMIKVDRSDPDVAAVNRQARETLARRKSVIVYPEGTRSLTGEIGPFKIGAFAIAAANEVPVLPVTTEGTGEAWAKGSKRVYPASVRVTIGPPISAAGDKADASALRDRARWVITSNRMILASQKDAA
jgi:1-acyl-sn-glycerol-3-phosphate acyltransferase